MEPTPNVDLQTFECTISETSLPVNVHTEAVKTSNVVSCPKNTPSFAEVVCSKGNDRVSVNNEKVIELDKTDNSSTMKSNDVSYASKVANKVAEIDNNLIYILLKF